MYIWTYAVVSSFSYFVFQHQVVLWRVCVCTYENVSRKKQKSGLLWKNTSWCSAPGSLRNFFLTWFFFVLSHMHLHARKHVLQFFVSNKKLLKKIKNLWLSEGDFSKVRQLCGNRCWSKKIIKKKTSGLVRVMPARSAATLWKQVLTLSPVFALT